MRDVKCLYLEDDKEAFDRNSRSLRVWWKKVLRGHIEFEHVDTIDGAIDKLETPEGTYDVFISDILFPPVYTPDEKDKSKHDPRFDAIQAASKKEKLLVVGLSIGKEPHYRFAEQATNAGANLFHYAGEVFPAAGRFCQEVYDLLVQKGIVEDATPLEFDKDDPRVSYIVNEIGEAKLKALYKQVLPGDAPVERMTATYLAPGMSGAFVVRMEAEMTRLPAVTHLVKVSTNKKRLADEVAKCPTGGPYAARLTVNYHKEVAAVEEWYGIGAVFEKGTVPFKEWLLTERTDAEIAGVLQLLFMEGGLREGYGRDIGDPENPMRAVEALWPSLSRQARIMEAIDQLGDAAAAASLGGLGDWEAISRTLRDYLTAQQVGKRSPGSTPRKSFLCKCHGDLHTRNIVVTTGGPAVPTIVDWPEFDTYHWATDYARLLADLLLAAYDTGVRSYEWGHLAEWRDIASKAVGLEELPVTDICHDKSTIRAANWMIKNLSLVCPAVQEHSALASRLWEFQLAISVELMRGAYRVDLTGPKRVFGLAGAYDAMKAAEASLCA